MSLTNTSAAAAAVPPASLTVDELEAKLNALHDYLSTPYRSRAEAILQQRRRRERALAEPAAPTPLRITSTAALVREADEPPRLPAPRVDSPPSLAEQIRMDSGSTAAAAVVHTVDSPATSLLTDSGSRAEPTVSLASTTVAATNHREDHRSVVQGSSEEETTDVRPSLINTAAAPLSHDECIDGVGAQRRIQRLEWQVQMLADALQSERVRYTQLQDNVVVPLQAMMEESLRRVVELEWELSAMKQHKDKRQ